MTTSPASAGPPQLLDAALRRDPARPLITFYDDATDERTELSVATFANWVAKTANLLRDDLGLEPGATAALDLPAHWQAAVWLQACWALGLHVVPAGSVADLTVVAYGGAAPAGSGEVVALGLGPMGLPRRDAEPPLGTTVGDDVLAGADLVAAARAAAPLPAGARLLVAAPMASLPAVLAGLLVPLATDVTAVLCRHLDPSRLPDRARQEGLVAAVGTDTPDIPAWSVGGSR
jgi:hypothetical protein